MPLVKGTRSRLFTGASQPRPPYITEVEKLQDALKRSEHEVLRMREQMEFLAFLVRRAWQGDRGAMTDVASIVGCESSSVRNNIQQYSRGNEESEDQEGERWADMVEKMLWVEREKEAQQTSTVKLVERECLLEEEMENHTPIFSSYLNKPRGNFKQKLRAKSAGPVRSAHQIRPNTMTKGPTVPSPTPRPSSARPRSAPGPPTNVSVHGSEVMIAHTKANTKAGRFGSSKARKNYYLQKRLGIPDEAIVLF